ncbi:hypothetical protein V6N13_098162 [Hibiscus sabdariffa]|uniref:Uncharacterized protein n=1 Tax=Hibiscus sabdariffa TaxID=183260 RepID=A0ABR2EGL7_9ROSI
MGLEDVLRISGLPIDGSLVIENEKITDVDKTGKEKVRELCFQYLGASLEFLNSLSWNVIAGEDGGVQNQEEEIVVKQDANNPMHQHDDQLLLTLHS